ncbi:hypothetical protein CXU07_04445 [Akkermansia muciniphila]|nr:hypothetical protein [Akkermansia sp.]PNC63984.1 hypothetical protein CXU07_04445 [Akkermansia muciniphila]
MTSRGDENFPRAAWAVFPSARFYSGGPGEGRHAFVPQAVCAVGCCVPAGLSSREGGKRAGLDVKEHSSAWKRVVFSSGGRIGWHE